VLLKVTHCGVCHSDLHLQDGYFDLGGGNKLDVRGNRPMPFTLGHEIAGTVEAAGPEAQGVGKGVAKGKFYAAYPWIGCGKCALCARGDEHLCNAPRALGITVDGGYATHVLVPHPRYLLDVEGIAPEIAGLLMCSGLTGYGAVKKALPYLRSGPLLVVGLGGVGMMGLQFARALTDAPILAADIDAAKRETALKLGAKEAFDPADAGARKAIAKASGGGVGAAVDFAGSDKSLGFAQSVVAKGGAAIVVGLLGGSFTLPVPMFPLRALTVMGSYVGSPAEAREMLDLVKAGRIAPIPVETRPLSETSRSLDDLRAGRIVGRVVIMP
jgi:D-arabinose 1-dehydrogenase-like Zn-dependent alcohol dehydrogenase